MTGAFSRAFNDDLHMYNRFKRMMELRSRGIETAAGPGDDGVLEISVTRQWEGDDSTVGELAWEKDGIKHSGFMLEPAGPSSVQAGSDLRISPGTYWLDEHNGTIFRGVFRLRDVPGRSDILIHSGNRGTHTLGCLLPGTNRNGFEVTGSVTMRDILFQDIRASSAARITIHEPDGR